MTTSIDELSRFETEEQRGIDRQEPDRTALKLMHAVRLWLGRVLS
jgi:hypothetical protein